jgi:hypothetical protein
LFKLSLPGSLPTTITQRAATRFVELVNTKDYNAARQTLPGNKGRKTPTELKLIAEKLESLLKLSKHNL